MDTEVTLDTQRIQLQEEFIRIRKLTEILCAPLETDDYQIQSIIQTSPPKWHIAHMSWLFETFILSRFNPSYIPFNARYDYIFNSYYFTHGKMHARGERGFLSRPTVQQVYDYRAYVNEHMLQLIHRVNDEHWQDLLFYIKLGLNHEQQHQELLLMDIKHNFFVNPLKPAYREGLVSPSGKTRPMRWVEREAGTYQIGHGDDDFAYDSETPRHDVLLSNHRLADRFVTNGEYLQFMSDKGYQNPALWLSDGWSLLQQEGWSHPLYWESQEQGWQQFTLGGLRPLNLDEPVCHISFYEADAYARWCGRRLPLESELEVQLAQSTKYGNTLASDLLHPAPATSSAQWFGDLWAWTQSPYSAYPGFKPLAGSIGEYNGKFMSNQMVLKGGSCITPEGHTRASYRNFFYPNERWAFTGLRLAEDI